MAIISNFPLQFHPVTCLQKPSYYSFLIHTHVCISTHNNNYLSNRIVFLSQPKHFVPSIGSTRFHESTPLSKNLVPSVDFGLSEQEYGDDDDDDDVFEGRETVDTSFVSPWGEVEDVNDDYDDDEGREDCDASFVSNKKLLPWGEVKEYDVQRRKDVDASFVAEKEMPLLGGVEDDGHQGSIEVGLVNEHVALFLEEMDEKVLSNRILELSRTNKIRSAMEYFRSMELLGLCPNIHVCNSLLSDLLRNGWFDDCFKVFNFTKAKRITTGHTYILILMACAKAQGCDSALQFFRKLERECDVEKDFDAIVYNSMISICKEVDN